MLGNKMHQGNLLLLLVIYVRNSFCIIEDMYDLGTQICELYSTLDDIRLSSRYDTKSIDGLFSDKNVINVQIKHRLDHIHEKLSEISNSMKSKKLSDSVRLWPDNMSIYMLLDKIENFAIDVDKSYEEFHQFRNESQYHTTKTLREFIQSVIVDVHGEMILMRSNVIEKNEFLPNDVNLLDAISSSAICGFRSNHNTQTAVISFLDSVREAEDQRKVTVAVFLDFTKAFDSVIHENLLEKLAKLGGKQQLLNAQLCDGPEIISTTLFRLFEIVMIAELKANIMLAFANMYRYSWNPEWRLLNSFAREAFTRQFGLYVNNFALIMDIVDPLYLRACDAPDGIWIRGKNFHELEGTFQTTIFRYHWGVCKYASCNHIMFGPPNRCEPGPYDSRTTCSRTTAECTYLGAIDACVLKEGPYKFQYLNSTKLGSLGRNFNCPKNKGYLIHDGAGLNYVFAACSCNCYSSDNKISLLMMESQVTSHKVITGLRFIRQNRILYIQPREGTLDAYGYISRFSQRWIALPKTIEQSQIQAISRTNRVFFLDNLRLPPHFVLTGVKFNNEKRGNVIGFAIEIFGRPFDYKSGKLSLEPELRISRKVSSDDPGEEVSFEAVSSIHTKLRHSPNQANMKYVSLSQSKLADDFGQSTVPFFDAAAITTQPPSILGGIGIFHKGAEGYAGFISLKVFAIDYRKYFTDFQLVHEVDGKVSFNYSDHD